MTAESTDLWGFIMFRRRIEDHNPLASHIITYINTQTNFYQDAYTILNKIENNMDHMRILGTEPWSVILNQSIF